jgi:hypothetical protein
MVRAAARRLRLDRGGGIVFDKTDELVATFGSNRIEQLDGLRDAPDGTIIVTSWDAPTVWRLDADFLPLRHCSAMFSLGPDWPSTRVDVPSHDVDRGERHVPTPSHAQLRLGRVRITEDFTTSLHRVSSSMCAPGASARWCQKSRMRRELPRSWSKRKVDRQFRLLVRNLCASLAEVGTRNAAWSLISASAQCARRSFASPPLRWKAFPVRRSAESPSAAVSAVHVIRADSLSHGMELSSRVPPVRVIRVDTHLPGISWPRPWRSLDSVPSSGAAGPETILAEMRRHRTPVHQRARPAGTLRCRRWSGVGQRGCRRELATATG